MGSVTTQSQQLQQHVPGSRKRSNEQGDDEYSEKSKRQKEKTETGKDDLEDGANMSIQVEQVTVLSKQCISTGMQGGLPCSIQSLLRRDGKVRPGEPYGNLLKAVTERPSETINVEFTGTTTVDPATEFHEEMCGHKKACVLRYSDRDNDYYLKVTESGGVSLCKLVDFPTDDEYFFLIERIDAIAFAIESLKKRGWYLHCSELGKVSMKEERKGTPKDLPTWFTRIDHAVQYHRRSMVYDRNDSGIECDFFEETTLNVKDPGNAVEEKSEEAKTRTGKILK